MDDHRKAVVFGLLAAASFAVMGVFVKAAAESGLLERVLVRNLVTLLISFVAVLRSGARPFGRPENRWRLLLRALFGIGGVACYFYSIDHLYLADAAMLNKISPFVVLVGAWIFLRERPGRATVVALALAFGGALLVIKPRFDLSILPALVGLASAFFAGSAYTLVRSLRNREPPEVIVFVFSLVTVMGLLPFVLADFSAPSGRELLLMLGIGLGAAGGQFGLTHAFRHGPAAEVALYSYGTIVFSAVFGFAIWSELPDRLSLMGGLLILSAALLVFFQARGRGEASSAPRS